MWKKMWWNGQVNLDTHRRTQKQYTVPPLWHLHWTIVGQTKMGNHVCSAFFSSHIFLIYFRCLTHTYYKACWVSYMSTLTSYFHINISSIIFAKKYPKKAKLKSFIQKTKTAWLICEPFKDLKHLKWSVFCIHAFHYWSSLIKMPDRSQSAINV